MWNRLDRLMHLYNKFNTLVLNLLYHKKQPSIAQYHSHSENAGNLSILTWKQLKNKRTDKSFRFLSVRYSISLHWRCISWYGCSIILKIMKKQLLVSSTAPSLPNLYLEDDWKLKCHYNTSCETRVNSHDIIHDPLFYPFQILLHSRTSISLFPTTQKTSPFSHKKSRVDKPKVVLRNGSPTSCTTS